MKFDTLSNGKIVWEDSRPNCSGSCWWKETYLRQNFDKSNNEL
jgi:hypothetical protein